MSPKNDKNIKECFSDGYNYITVWEGINSYFTFGCSSHYLDISFEMFVDKMVYEISNPQF